MAARSKRGARGGSDRQAVEAADVARFEARRVMQVQARSAPRPTADDGHMDVAVAVRRDSEARENCC